MNSRIGAAAQAYSTKAEGHALTAQRPKHVAVEAHRARDVNGVTYSVTTSTVLNVDGPICRIQTVDKLQWRKHHS